MVMFGHGYRRRLAGIVATMRQALRAFLWARPAVGMHATGIGVDLVRSRAQLLVLRRSVPRPAAMPMDRALLVLLAGRVRAWHQAPIVVQPETLLRWHRAGFRAFWGRKSRSGPGRPPLSDAAVALIRRMAAENPLWGAERIRSELQKLGVRVAKRTIQTYLPAPRAPRPRGQTWATFLRVHVASTWACNFLPVDYCRRGVCGGVGDRALAPPRRYSPPVLLTAGR